MKTKIWAFYGILALTLGGFFPSPPTYAQSANPKRIEINLSTQHLYAFQGDTLVYNFLISSGTIDHPTITGTFHPYVKLLSTAMIGGTPGTSDYYGLPNVPYTMYFYQGYGIHGTYWHHNFGHPMSHGCINLATSDAQKLFYWTTLDTPITIYGTTPSS
jgi:lipoprotein-anchoring transpeptidase ErfK/SrfK